MKLRKSQKTQNAEPEKLSRAKRIQREIMAWMWIILIFLLINGTLGQARVIPSASMQNTLLIGDHLIMSRVGYDAGIPFTHWHVPLWRSLKRQQLAIFLSPASPDAPDLIKRVIGLPGEKLDIHDSAVWINGQKLDEPYTTGRTLPGDMHFPYVIPDNCYFMMGDNREDSYDSRYMGCISRKNIIGTPVIIYMSVDAAPNAWDEGQIRERFFAYANALIHPSEIRWKRLFKTF